MKKTVLGMLFGLSVLLSANDMVDKGKVAYDLGHYKEAFELYRQAAEQGDAEAQNKLANMYNAGENVKKNPKQAVEWYQKAADQGYANAQSNLALAYDQGTGTITSKSKAEKYYKSAFDLWSQEVKKGDSLVQYFLADCFIIMALEQRKILKKLLHCMNKLQIKVT